MTTATDLSGGVPRWLLRKLFGMLLTMLAVSFLVFAVLELNVNDVAVKVLGQFSTEDQRHAWLVQNGYTAPFLLRYLRWIGEFVTGHWGTSTYYREDVLTLIAPRLAASGLLAGAALLVIVPLGLVMGVIAGMREGSFVDRLVSVFAIVTTSIPEFASAVFLTSLFVFWLGWLPGVSTMADGFHLQGVGAAGGCADSILGGLHRPYDPIQHGRGDAVALHPHRAAERQLDAQGHRAPCAS